jgi:hypothetical protein
MFKPKENPNDPSRLFLVEYNGSLEYTPEKWMGNTRTPNTVQYGFLIVTGVQAQNGVQDGSDVLDQFFLQIPPQAFNQKEIFANNIQATRKGVIVETEGVVFKDIVLKGTTGVFPGKRGSYQNERPGERFVDPPKPPAGVDEATGKSLDTAINTNTGYTEFLALRQFFLKYSTEKLETNGNRFLIFVNEKDNQNLIVEPMEFSMERDSKSPMAYNYTIVLKCIGSLDSLFQRDAQGDEESGVSLLQEIGNVAANVSARVKQGRATINQSRRLLERFTQAIDGTINDPLRQIQFATQDLADGVSTTLSLPRVLSGNARSAVLGIRESFDDIDNSVNGFSNQANTGVGATQQSESSQEFQASRAAREDIENDTRVPIPRLFVENVVEEIASLTNTLTDAFNINSDEFNEIVGHK